MQILDEVSEFSITIIQKGQCKTQPDSKVFQCLKIFQAHFMELSSSRGGLYPLSLANTVKEVASLGKAGWAEASIPSIPDILLQKMEPGAATTQAAGPGHLTLSNTHGVLPNRIWPRVRPKGKWTCRCSLRRIRYSAPPLWDLTSGARSPFICLTTRRHCRSTMILRLSLPRRCWTLVRDETQTQRELDLCQGNKRSLL